MNKLGTIYLVATPIGNLEDMTLRAIRILNEVEIVYAEDTRSAQKLFNQFKIRNKIDSFHSYNEKKRAGQVLDFVEKGNNVALISDAGTPGISDPAYSLVKQAINRGISIVPIPGATALVTALIASGLPTDRFYFQGFLPLKKGRQKELTFLSELPHTVIIYESIHRLEKTLNQLYDVFGDRYTCIARELTKIHESFYRGNLKVLLDNFGNMIQKGEVVIVIAGKTFKPIERELNEFEI